METLNIIGVDNTLGFATGKCSKCGSWLHPDSRTVNTLLCLNGCHLSGATLERFNVIVGNLSSEIYNNTKKHLKKRGKS